MTNTFDAPIRFADQLDGSRLKRLYDELSFALSRTDRDTLRSWGGRSAGRLVVLTGKRVRAFSGLIAQLGKSGAGELRAGLTAMQAGRFVEQLGDRTAAAIDGSIRLTQDTSRLIGGIGRTLVDDPATNAPRVFAAFLGFYAGSGGIDGDGGIPDLDLLAGIDAHRSILTHSIIAGIVAEGLLLAITDLAGEIHDRLPLNHDKFWDQLAQAGAPIAAALGSGASAGIAYHLLWDSVIEPAPYHHLPVSIPMEGHEAIMGTSGVAEAVHAANRGRGRKPATLHQGLPAIPSTGRKVVDGIAEAANRARQFGQDLWGRFGQS